MVVSMVRLMSYRKRDAEGLWHCSRVSRLERQGQEMQLPTRNEGRIKKRCAYPNRFEPRRNTSALIHDYLLWFLLRLLVLVHCPQRPRTLFIQLGYQYRNSSRILNTIRKTDQVQVTLG